jgi:diguanylate cyclase (GGDEF)-like protein/PAS domain S-box-containing protein
MNFDRKKFILAALILTCVLLDYYFGFMLGVKTVYVHLFYLPVFLASGWYGKAAVYIAIFLGVHHGLTIFAADGYVDLGSLERSLFLVGVGFFVGWTGEQKNKIEKILKEGHRALVESADDPITLLDHEGRYLSVNKKFLSRFGLSQAQVLGKTFADFHSPEDTQEFIDKFNQVIETGEVVKYEIHNSLFDRWYIRTLSPVGILDSNTATAVSLIAKDISNRKQAEAKIKQLAYYDQLTGLPKRTLLLDRLNQAMKEADRFGHQTGVLFLDMDNFKHINDSLGHAAGDAFLQCVAQRLTGCLRKNDTAARVGGDEFVLILSSIRQASNLVGIVRKIQQALSQSYQIDSQEVFGSASIGIALYPTDGKDVESLLKNADIAMYAAKKQDRNTYQFYSPVV